MIKLRLCNRMRSQVRFVKRFYKVSILGYRGVLRIMGGFCVLHMDDLIPIILGETHYSKYFIHPGVTKMYCNLKQPLNGVKKNVS